MKEIQVVTLSNKLKIVTLNNTLKIVTLSNKLKIIFFFRKKTVHKKSSEFDKEYNDDKELYLYFHRILVIKVIQSSQVNYYLFIYHMFSLENN